MASRCVGTGAREATWCLLATICLSVIAACGDGNGGNPASPSPVRVTRVLQEGGFNLDPAGEDHVHFALVSVSDPAPGRWQATVDWTFASSELWI